MGESTENYMTLSFENKRSFHWNLSTLSYKFNQPLYFGLFCIFDVFAVLCSVFTLYHMLTVRNLRQALQNHTLILMLLFGLVYDLIDIPLHLQFFSTGVVRPAIPELCLIWWFIDWSFFFTIEMLLLLTSIERHILIFHSQMLATRRKRLLIHYLPMLLTVLFVMTFYGVTIFPSIDNNNFDYTSDLCGMYTRESHLPLLIMFEQMGFSIMSTCFIVVFNIALLVRIVRQKHPICRCIQWRKQRKLAIQMALMSMLFLLFSLPLTLIYVVHLFGQHYWATEVFPTFFFLSYFSIFILPFVCLTSVPKIRDKIKKLVPRRRRRIAAAIIP